MPDCPKAVWSSLYVSVVFIAYRSSKVSDCIFEIPSCDNQALIGCTPITAVAVALNLKS